MYTAKMKTLNIIVQIILSLVCFLHIIFILDQEVNPKLPLVKNYEKGLVNTAFPLIFKICFNEHSSNRYRKVGYFNNRDFFKGLSMYDLNKNLVSVGWRGHSQNGSTLLTTEGKTCM